MHLVKVTEIILSTKEPPRNKTKWINPDYIVEIFEKDLNSLNYSGWKTAGLDKLYEVNRHNEQYLFIDYDSFLNLTNNNTTK